MIIKSALHRRYVGFRPLSAVRAPAEDSSRIQQQNPPPEPEEVSVR